jgi:hypothetical protein
VDRKEQPEAPVHGELSRLARKCIASEGRNASRKSEAPSEGLPLSFDATAIGGHDSPVVQPETVPREPASSNEISSENLSSKADLQEEPDEWAIALRNVKARRKLTEKLVAAELREQKIAASTESPIAQFERAKSSELASLGLEVFSMDSLQKHSNKDLLVLLKGLKDRQQQLCKVIPDEQPDADQEKLKIAIQQVSKALALRGKLANPAKNKLADKKHGPLNDREQKIWDVVKRGVKGAQYCREIHAVGVRPVWKNGPPTYPGAYQLGKPWCHRIQDEKYKIRRKAQLAEDSLRSFASE